LMPLALSALETFSPKPSGFFFPLLALDIFANVFF
jgi:hypothetical protein